MQVKKEVQTGVKPARENHTFLQFINDSLSAFLLIQEN